MNINKSEEFNYAFFYGNHIWEKTVEDGFNSINSIAVFMQWSLRYFSVIPSQVFKALKTLRGTLKGDFFC